MVESFKVEKETCLKELHRLNPATTTRLSTGAMVSWENNRRLQGI